MLVYVEELGGRNGERSDANRSCSPPLTYGPLGPGFLQGWEALGTSRSALIGEPVIIGARALKVHREDGIHMKNTGKRIFFSIVAFGLANLAIVVSAGAFTAQR